MTFDDMISVLANYQAQDWGKPMFTVVGRKGVAFRFVAIQEGTCALCDGVGAHHEQERDSEGDVVDITVECEDCDGYGEVETGMILLHAVGDNRIEAHDPTELELYMGDVCSCGQIGCEWH